MNIYLKNKFIYFKDYKIKCAIGKRGITNKKKEGDKCTPRGKYKLKYIIYRKDRIRNIKTKLKKIDLKRNFGWCDDVNSSSYNKLIRFPFKGKYEKLYLKDNTYDIIIVIDYNLNPIIKKKGSAIFIHVAKKNFSPTLGCIALSKKDLRKLLLLINKNTYITII